MIMRELSVVGIGVESRSGKPLVLLKEPTINKVLIIWIDSADANAIVRALQELEMPRPMTHDLMLNVIEDLNYNVRHVEINDTVDGDYRAAINLECQKLSDDKSGETIIRTIDARPSDAIALAVKARVPIYASLEIITENAVPIELEKSEDDDEFKDFIKDVKASDFFLPGQQEGDD